MASLTSAHLGMGTLGQYLLRKHASDEVETSLPSGICVDVKNDGYIHVESGVFVHSSPIRLSEGCSYQVLFHYTQNKFFDMIIQCIGRDSSQTSLLKASRDLSQDCDFGLGVYATEKGPDQFPDGIQGILVNNYPRKGPWGFTGEPSNEHHYLASYCIPIIVPRHWTKCFPLTRRKALSPMIFGPILERKMRQGHAFDPDRHNICVILNADIGELGELADGGDCAEHQIKEEINEMNLMSFLRPRSQEGNRQAQTAARWAGMSSEEAAAEEAYLSAWWRGDLERPEPEVKPQAPNKAQMAMLRTI